MFYSLDLKKKWRLNIRVGRFWNQAWWAVGKVGQNYFKPSGRFRFFARVQFRRGHFCKKVTRDTKKKYFKIYRYGYQKMRLKPLNTVHILVFWYILNCLIYGQKNKQVFQYKNKVLSLIGFIINKSIWNQLFWIHCFETDLLKPLIIGIFESR